MHDPVLAGLASALIGACFGGAFFLGRLLGREEGYRSGRAGKDRAFAGWKSLEAEHREALHLLLGLLTLLREHPEILIDHPTLTKRLTDWMSEPPVN